jgi:hypothetical protein
VGQLPRLLGSSLKLCEVRPPPGSSPLHLEQRRETLLAAQGQPHGLDGRVLTGLLLHQRVRGQIGDRHVEGGGDLGEDGDAVVRTPRSTWDSQLSERPRSPASLTWESPRRRR